MQWAGKLAINAAICVVVATVAEYFWPDARISLGFFIGYSMMTQLGRAW